MISFAIGFLVGSVTCLFIFIVLTFFRAGVEGKVRVIERVLRDAGPHPTGAIFLPKDESDIAREEHIKKNNEIGRDTPINELR